MRRNRRRDKSRGGADTTLSGDEMTLSGPQRGVPTLTDALVVDAASPLLPTVILPEGAADSDADPISFDTLSDLPVLTDAVEVAEYRAIAGEPASEAAPVPLFPEEVAVATDRAVEAAVPPAASAFVDEDFILEIPPPEESVPAQAGDRGSGAPEPREEEPGESGGALGPGDADWGTGPDRDAGGPAGAVPEPRPASMSASTPVEAAVAERESPDWDALADEIRAQVMQRLDLFTDTGLREQLGARLQPIVARASAELVETINRQVGDLVRSYVAEAIEREIDSWRSHHP
ncbi:MAG TPA: hypothetical protein VLU54_16150 [Casimicrobiaceae bacterium]|nr:hypothetical protein [Casimicrobiaceae bacterium]